MSDNLLPICGVSALVLLTVASIWMNPPATRRDLTKRIAVAMYGLTLIAFFLTKMGESSAVALTAIYSALIVIMMRKGHLQPLFARSRNANWRDNDPRS